MKILIEKTPQHGLNKNILSMNREALSTFYGHLQEEVPAFQKMELSQFEQEISDPKKLSTFYRKLQKEVPVFEKMNEDEFRSLIGFGKKTYSRGIPQIELTPEEQEEQSRRRAAAPKTLAEATGQTSQPGGQQPSSVSNENGVVSQNLEDRKEEQDVDADNAAINTARIPLSEEDHNAAKFNWKNKGKKPDQPSYLSREEKTMDDVVLNILESWGANTDEGKAAIAAYNERVQNVTNLYEQQLDRLKKELQKKVNNGILTVDAANAELQKRANEFQIRINEENNEAYGAYVKNATDANMDYIVKKQREIGNQLVGDYTAEAIPAIDEKISELVQNERRRHMKVLRMANKSGHSLYDYQPKYDSDIAIYRRAQEFLEEAQEMRNAAINNYGLKEGLGESLSDVDTWDMGLAEYMRSKELNNIVAKLEKNNNDTSVLSEPEKALLDAYSIYLQSCAYNSEHIGTWYKAGQTTGIAIPFMLEVAATSGLGIGSAAAKGVAKTIFNATVRKGVTSKIGRASVKAVARLTGAVVDTAIQTAIFDAPKIAAGVEKRTLGDVMTDFNSSTNEIEYNGVREGSRQSKGEAIYNATASTAFENLGERVLEAANPFTSLLGKRIAMSSIFTKLGRNKWVSAIMEFNNQQWVKNLRRSVHFGGYPQEVLEEEVTGLMNLLCTDVNSLKDAGLDVDSQIDILAGLLPTSLAFGGLGAASVGYHYAKPQVQYYAKFMKDSRDILNVLSSNAERELYGRMLTESRTGEFGEQAHDLIRAVVTSDTYTPEQKKMILEDVIGRYYNVISDELKNTAKTIAEERYGETIDERLNQLAGDKEEIARTVDKKSRPVVIVGDYKSEERDGEQYIVGDGKKRNIAIKFIKPDGTIDEEAHNVSAASLPFPIIATPKSQLREKWMAQQTAVMIGADTFVYNGKTYSTTTGQEVEKKETPKEESDTSIAAPTVEAPMAGESEESQEELDEAVEKKVEPTLKYVKIPDGADSEKRRGVYFSGDIVHFNADGTIDDTKSKNLVIWDNENRKKRWGERKIWLAALNNTLKRERAEARQKAQDAIDAKIAAAREQRENEDNRKPVAKKRADRAKELKRDTPTKEGWIDTKHKDVTPEMIFYYNMTHADLDTAFNEAVEQCVEDTLRIQELRSEEGKKLIPKAQDRNAEIHRCEARIVAYEEAVKFWVDDTDTAHNVGQFRIAVSEGVKKALNITENEAPDTIEGEGQGNTNSEGKPKPKKEKKTKPEGEKLEARSDEIYDHIKVETTKNENTGLTDYVYIPYAKAEEGQEPQPVKLAGKFINRNIITGGAAKEFIDEHPNDIRDIQVTNAQETSEKDVFVANVIITTKDGQSSGYIATLNELPKVGASKREKQEPVTPPTEKPKTPKKPKATPKWPNPFDEHIALVKTANGSVVFKSRAEVKDGETEYDTRIVYAKEGNKYVKYAIRSVKQKIGLNSTVAIVDANGVEKMMPANQLFSDEQGTPFVADQNTKLKVDNFGHVAAYPVYTSANGTQFTLQDLLTEHKHKTFNEEKKTTKTETISGYEYVKQQVEAENPDDPKAVEDFHKNIKHILDMWNVLASKLLDSKGYSKAMLLAYRYLYYKSSIDTQYNLAAEAEKDGKDASKFYIDAHKIDALIDGKVDFSIGSGFDSRNLSGHGLNNPLYRLASMIEITKDMPEVKGVDFNMQLPDDIEKALKAKIITAKQIEEARAKYNKLEAGKKKLDPTSGVASDVADQLTKLENDFPEVKNTWVPLTRPVGKEGFDKVKQLLKQEAGETRRNRKLSKEQEALKSFRDLCQQAIDALRANDNETFNKLNEQISKTVTEHMADKVNKFANQMVSYQNNIRNIMATAFPEVAQLATLHRRLDNTLATIAKKKQKVDNLQLRLDHVNAELDGIEAMQVSVESNEKRKEQLLEQKADLEEKLAAAKEDAARAPMNNPDQLRAALNDYIAEHQEAEQQYQEMMQQEFPENGLRLDLMAEDLDMSISQIDKSDWSKKHSKLIIDFLRSMGIQIDIVSHEELLAMLPENQRLILLQNNKTLYGLADGKRVWLNRDTLNTNVPVHESAHLWVHAFAENHPEEWKAMIETLKQTEMWQKVYNSEAYAKYRGNDSAMANEVMARLVGDYYAQRGMFSLSLFEEQADKTLVAKVARAIRKILNYVFDKLGWTLPVNRSKDFSREVRRLLAMPINDIIAYGGERGAIIAKANAKQKLPGWIRPAADVDMMTRRTDETIRGWLANRGDLDANMINAVIHAIDELESNKLQLTAGKWYANGKVRLPEDLKKIRQAVAVAERAKVDPMRYDSPMAIIEAFPEIEIKEKPIDPNTVPTLHKAAEFDNGIVIYDVDEGDESRQNMRAIINTHFGKDSSPWCLLQGDENGKLTSESEYYWNHYKAYPKQVAFKDSHLVAFSANDNAEKVWWDRMDMSHNGISLGKVDVGLGKVQERLFNPNNNTYENAGPIERYSEDGRIQEVWNENGFRVRTRIKTIDGDVKISYRKDSNRIESIRRTKGNDSQYFGMTLSGTGIVYYVSDENLRATNDFDFVMHRFDEKTKQGNIVTKFDNDGVIESVIENDNEGRISVSFYKGNAIISIDDSIDDGDYMLSAARILMQGDRVSKIYDEDSSIDYTFDEAEHVSSVQDGNAGESIYVEDGVFAIKADKNSHMIHIDESDPRYEEIAARVAAGQARLEALKDRYEGLLEYGSVASEDMFEHIVNAELKDVLADAFGLSSTDNILSADQNGVLDGLDLMTDLDMMVDNYVETQNAISAYETSIEEIHHISELASANLIKAEKDGTNIFSDPTKPDGLKFDEWNVRMSYNADMMEGMRIIQNSIAAYRKARGLDNRRGFWKRLAGIGEETNIVKDVRTMFEASGAAASNKIKSFRKNERKQAEEAILELQKNVKGSKFYKEHKTVTVNGKKQELTPLQFIELYLMARNNWQRAEDEKTRGAGVFAEMFGIDNVGVMGITLDKMSATEQFAKAFFDSYDKALIADMWDKLGVLTRLSLKIGHEGGLITDEEYERLSEKKFYIPQRGFWDRVNQEEGKENLEPRAIKRNGKWINKLSGMQKAEGGLSLAEGPLAYIFSDVEEAIQKSEDNKVKVELFHLLRDNADWCREPEIDFQVPTEVFYRVDDEGNINRVENGYSPEEIDNFKTMRKRARELEAYKKKGGLTVEQIREVDNEIDDILSQIPLDAADTRALYGRRMKDNEGTSIGVMVNGYPCEIVLPKNFKPTADAFNGKRYTDGQVEWLRKSTGYFAANLTVNNPTFWPVNIARDTMFINLKGIIEYGPLFNIYFAGNFLACQVAINKYLFTGKFPKDTEGKRYATYMKEFLESGGNTGYSSKLDMLQYRDDVKALDITTSKKREYISTAWDAAMFKHVANGLNEWSEITSRFAAYCSVREMGYDKLEGIKAAKNLSVNFDRKGLGSIFLNIFQQFSVFVNAAIQGTIGKWRALGTEGGSSTAQKVGKVAWGLTVMELVPAFFGFLNTMMLPDDDEKEIIVSDWDRDNYIILPRKGEDGVPGIGRWPLDQTTRPAWCIGVNIAMLVKQRRSWKKAVNSILTSIVENSLPIPQNLSNAASLLIDDIFEKDYNNIGKITVAAITPSYLEQMNYLANHENFLGGKMRSDVGDIPEYEMGENESELAKLISRAFYRFDWFGLSHGGDPNVSSKHYMDENGNLHRISGPHDINPKEVKNYVNGIIIPSGTIDIIATMYGLAWEAVDAATKDDYQFGEHMTLKREPIIHSFAHDMNAKNGRIRTVSDVRKEITDYEDALSNALGQAIRYNALSGTYSLRDDDEVDIYQIIRAKSAEKRYADILNNMEYILRQKALMSTYNSSSTYFFKTQLHVTNDKELQEALIEQYGEKQGKDKMKKIDDEERRLCLAMKFLYFEHHGLKWSNPDREYIDFTYEW